MLRTHFVTVGMVFLGTGAAQAVDGTCGSANGNLIGTAPTTILCSAGAPSPAGSMTTYYVSSAIGHDKNAGTSATAPLASLQAAANLVKPGDTVEVMNGTYTSGGPGAALDIHTSGTASAPITFEAAPGQTPVINSSGAWAGIYIAASYINVKGFTVVGGAANYNLSQAAGNDGTDPNLNGNGIRIQPNGSVSLPHHITIENNTVYNVPGGGIASDGADYLQIRNNVVHDTSNWSWYGTSGITVNTSQNLDTNPGPHMIISGNTSYNNADMVPSQGSGMITDGEGIFLDSNEGYTGGFLVQNNTAYGNGGPGIESFLSDNATITGNTVYGNNTNNSNGAATGGIFINQSNNNTVTNNITTAP
jgi:parallel beta-helix repeat protein